MHVVETFRTSDLFQEEPSQPTIGKVLTVKEIYANAKAIVPQLRAARKRIEEARRIPEDIHKIMLEAGLFRMNMPKMWGGPEMTSMQQVEIIEEVSRGCGSAGWCLMIGCDSGLYSSFLEDSAARALYPRLDMVQAGWVAPQGKIRRVPGGFIVNGHWSFGSGCLNSDVIGGGCYLADEHGELILDANGNPDWRIILAPKEDYTIHDTWFTSGLVGTGSHDYEAIEMFVPEERTFNFLKATKRPGTLYATNDTFLRKIPAIPLGVAREAIDYTMEVVERKVDRVTKRPYRESELVQTAIGEAEMLVTGARAYLFASLEAQWARLDAGLPLRKKERKDLMLSRYMVFDNCRKAVQVLYDTLGGSSIYVKKGPLDSFLRDINTSCQHIVGQAKMKTWAGSLLLDEQVAWPFAYC